MSNWRYVAEILLVPTLVFGAAGVAEPPRRDATQQEIKEWFLENYYGRAPVGRPADMEFKGNEIWIGGGKVKLRLDVTLPSGAAFVRITLSGSAGSVFDHLYLTQPSRGDF